MKPLNRFEVRLNLIDLVTEYVREMLDDPEMDEGQDEMLRLLSLYRIDTARQMKGQDGDLDYLFDNLKAGIRLAGALMQEIQEDHAEALQGWIWGCASNTVQRFYDLIFQTTIEFTSSIQEIESRYPQYKQDFDLEREAHQRVTLGWQRLDEEEREQLGEIQCIQTSVHTRCDRHIPVS